MARSEEEELDGFEFNEEDMATALAAAMAANGSDFGPDDALTALEQATMPGQADLLLGAAMRNDVEDIKFLIQEMRVSPSHSNKVGQSALHVACLWGNGK